MTKEECMQKLSAISNYCCAQRDKDALDMAIDYMKNSAYVIHAKWVPNYGNVSCSSCGHTEDAAHVGKATHYCSFCGAKMDKEQQGESTDGKID